MVKTTHVQVKGVAELRRMLKKKQREHSRKFAIGVKRAGLWLLRESMKIVPVDTSALKNSAPNVTRADGMGWDTVMTVGYGQEYAIYVHEDLNARHKPGKVAKFLETPLRNGRGEMRKLIRDAMTS